MRGPLLTLGPGGGENYKEVRSDADGNLLVIQNATSTLAPVGFDKMEITAYTPQGSPRIIVYSKGATVLVTWELTYNEAGDFQKAEKASLVEAI